MKRFLIVLAAVVIVLMSSCGGDSVKVIKIPDAENVTVSLEGDVPELLAPRAMGVAAGRLVIYEEKVDQPFMVIGLPFNGQYHRILSRGRGPMEVISPFPGIIPVKDGFQVVDMVDGVMKRFIFEGDRVSLAKTEEIPFMMLPCGIVLPFGDGYLYNSSVYRDMVKEDEGFDYHYIHPSTGEITRLCPTPEWDDGVEGSDDVILRLSTPAVHPYGSMFATFYFFHNRIIYYDAQGNILKEMATPLEGVMEKFEEPVYYMCVVASNENWIIAQYGDKEFHFFDWNGNMKRRISLDKSLAYPAFDFASGKLYGLDLSDEDSPQLYSAQIL